MEQAANLHKCVTNQPGGMYGSREPFSQQSPDLQKLGFSKVELANHHSLSDAKAGAQGPAHPEAPKPHSASDPIHDGQMGAPRGESRLVPATAKVTDKSADKPMQNHMATTNEQIDAKEQYLHKRYGVTFSKPGELAENMQQDGKWGSSTCRQPSMKELTGIEAALKNNPSSQDETRGSRGLKFYFPKDDKIYPDRFAAAGKDRNGDSAVFVQPALSAYPATMKEAKKDDPEMHSVERFISHELTHSEEVAHYNTLALRGAPLLPKELQSKPGERIQTNDNAFEAVSSKQYEKIGWKLFNCEDGSKIWGLKNKDGTYSVNTSSINDSDDPDEWVRVNGKGQYLDEKGKPLPKGSVEAPTIDAVDARHMAKVNPATNYFYTPREMLAEGMSYYRSPEGRASLSKNNHDLYTACKEIDQENLDRKYGTLDGHSAFIRTPDGKVVRNSKEAADQVKRFETAAAGH
jgi:hypothetical protein